MGLDHQIIRIFGTIKECAEYFIEQDSLSTTVQRFRSKIKYYSQTGHCMLQKYYIRIIRPNNIDNTVPSLQQEEGQTTIESITNEKDVCEEASRVEEM